MFLELILSSPILMPPVSHQEITWRRRGKEMRKVNKRPITAMSREDVLKPIKRDALMWLFFLCSLVSDCQAHGDTQMSGLSSSSVFTLPVDLRNSWADPRMTLQSRSVQRKRPTRVLPSVMRILMFLFRSPSSFCLAWDDEDTSDCSWVRAER